MIDLQRALYQRMAQDSELLKILGLNTADESEISKRIVPTPPGTDMQEIETLIHFRFPPTALLNSPVMETRPIQFRIWGSDSSLEIQQNISKRLQEIMIVEDIAISGFSQYSNIFYINEAQVPSQMFGKFGWLLNLEIHTRVHTS